MPDLSSARELREKRAHIAKEMGDIARLAQTEGRKFSPEEREKFDKLNSDCDSYLERAVDLERVEDLERDMKAPVDAGLPNHVLLTDGRRTDTPPADKDKIITNRDADLALRAWALREDAPTEWRQSAEKMGLNIFSKQTNIPLCDSRDYRDMQRRFREDGVVYRATTAQSKGTNAKGGFGVPTTLRATIEEALLAFGGMREKADVFRTSGGENLNIATADDTTTLATINSENSAISVSDLTLAQLTLRAHTFVSGIVLSSVELIQDEAIDFVGYIGRALGNRLARGTNAQFTTGSTATTSPRGIIRDSAIGFSATTTSGDITHVSLTNLLHSVDVEYRRSSRSGWMMHDGIVKEARQIVDSQGNPIWQIGMQTGQPDRLYGHDVVVNNRLTSSSTGSGAILALFGDLGKYAIREVTSVDLFRFDEKYMNSLQVGWLSWLRADGRLLVASTRAGSKPVKHLVGTT